MNGKVREGAKREKVPGSGGSRKGKPNKMTVELKTMVLQALDGAGGVEYLIKRANSAGPPLRQRSAAFCASVSAAAIQCCKFLA